LNRYRRYIPPRKGARMRQSTIGHGLLILFFMVCMALPFLLPLKASAIEDSIPAKTTVILENGELDIYASPEEINWQDLSGLSFQVRTHGGQDNLVAEGAFVSGRLRNGVLNAKSAVGIREALVFQIDGGVLFIHPDTQIAMGIRKNQLRFVRLANLDCVVEVSPKDATDPLKLVGNVKNGSYTPDEGVSIKARLTIAEDFTYKKETVTTKLIKGGTIGVAIQNNEFKSLNFSGLPVLADIPIEDGLLALKGVVNGNIKPDAGISFTGALEVLDGFTYRKEKVSTTLKSGGFLTVKVEANQFQKAEFNIQGELDVDLPNMNGLLLGGTLSGKYENDLLDLDCGLALREPWKYEHPRVQARLTQSQSVSVVVRQSEFRGADLSNSYIDVVIKVGDKTLPLGGEITEGKYQKDGKLNLLVSLYVDDILEFKFKGRPIIIQPGPVFLQVIDGKRSRAILTAENLRLVLDPPDDDGDSGGQNDKPRTSE